MKFAKIKIIVLQFKGGLIARMDTLYIEAMYVNSKYIVIENS